MSRNKKNTLRTLITAVVLFLLIPFTIWLGVWLFQDRKYNIISIIIALLSCVPSFVRFEKGKSGAREMIIIAVMVAFSVVGRLAFAPIPAFKPVTAITIISGVALGPEAGFIVGSMTAVVSNMFYGQGPWTPFQMFVWGFIGFLAGVIFGKNKKPSRSALSIVGAFGGVLFSLLMDIWATISLDGEFILSRYLVNVASSLSFMAIYAVSNIVFLIVLAHPFLEKLNRIKIKYGIFDSFGDEYESS